MGHVPARAGVRKARPPRPGPDPVETRLLQQRAPAEGGRSIFTDTAADRGASAQTQLLPFFGAEGLERVDHHHAVRLDLLHDREHAGLGDGHTAAGIGLDPAQAVQEDGAAVARNAGVVVADVEAVLVFGGIVDDVLLFLILDVFFLPALCNLK